jgi:hypothetical protein
MLKIITHITLTILLLVVKANAGFSFCSLKVQSHCTIENFACSEEKGDEYANDCHVNSAENPNREIIGSSRVEIPEDLPILLNTFNFKMHASLPEIEQRTILYKSFKLTKDISIHNQVFII